MRDALRDRFGVRAVEMEGSGIADASWTAGSVGYLVVRGTCDYCDDANKNDQWHCYAALIAAAYSRVIVEYVPPLCDRAEVSQQFAGTSGLPWLQPHLTTSALQQPIVDRSDEGHGSLPPDPSLKTASPVLSSQAMNEGTTSTILPTTIALAQLVEHGRRKELDDFVEAIDSLMKEHRWKDVYALEQQLERCLISLPFQGTRVRDGWIVLARIEDHRLHEAKLAGKAFDLSRVRALRKEAERVVD